MIAYTHRNFDKKYLKLSRKLRERFKERRDIFLANPYEPILNNHGLHEPYAGCRSINVTGDYRAIFHHERSNVVRFIDIDTHHNLFGT